MRRARNGLRHSTKARERLAFLIDVQNYKTQTGAKFAGAAVSEVSAAGATIRRHSILTRLTHWVNVFCLSLLLMSGLQIFNAHPALHWGDASNFQTPLIAIGRFPGWATIPSYQDLAGGRLWHFFFAWILVINGA